MMQFLVNSKHTNGYSRIGIALSIISLWCIIVHAQENASEVSQGAGNNEGSNFREADDKSSSAGNCEIELTYSASGITMPRFDASFAIRNNRKTELNAWQVGWKFESDKVIPGSIEGAILLSTGSNRGSPARVVNTRKNIPILPFSTRGFTFSAFSAFNEQNVSRAPESVSVNGLSCELLPENDQTDESSLCLPTSNSSALSFLSSCVASYCCGGGASQGGDIRDGLVLQKAMEARHSLLPALVERDSDDVVWTDCSEDASLFLIRNATMDPNDVLIGSVIEPGGLFGLCTNTSVGPIFGEDFFDFFLMTNAEKAVSLNILLGLTQNTGKSDSGFKAIVEAELPLYEVTDLNTDDPWKRVNLDLKDIGVPGWAFFGIRNNMDAPVPLLLYDMGLYAAVDQSIAQAQKPPSILWNRSPELEDLAAKITARESSDPTNKAILPAILCTSLAVVFIIIISTVGGCMMKKRREQRLQMKNNSQKVKRNSCALESTLSSSEVLRSYESISSTPFVMQIDDLNNSAFNVDFQNDVMLEQVIGSGGFGTVHKATWKGESVAVKIMHGMMDGTHLLENFKKEITLLSKLKHPCIINFLGASLSPPDVCIIQELADEGSLYTALHGSGNEVKPLKYVDVLLYGMDIADAMSYLHPTIVHRDLKSQNVLLDSSRRAKVCDFGIAKFKEKTFLTTVNSHAGTPSYMAPELFSNGEISEKCDVFSFGVLLWECFTGCIPWDELSTPMQVIFAVGVQKQRLPIPPTCPTFLSRLMADCWREEPDDRPSFQKILTWLEEEHQRYVIEKSLRTAGMKGNIT